MNNKDVLFASLVWLVIFWSVLFGIQIKLDRIATALEIIASPPQTVELQHKSAKGE